MPLIDCLNNYRNSIVEANTFIDIAFAQSAKGDYIHQQFQRDFITDSTFFKIFVAWETFLESCFINYMLGEVSISGKSIACYSNPQDIEHATKMIIGTQRYFDWADPAKVRQLCNLYFAAGNPLDSYLGSSMAALKELKIIRNSVAHVTSSTTIPLDLLAYKLLKKKYSNITVSQLIFSIDPNSKNKDTILQKYLNILDMSAEGIANG